MKKLFSIAIAVIVMAIPILSLGQQETKAEQINEQAKTSGPISYTFINEYGFYGGSAFGFSGIFVNGIKFNKTQDVIGIGLGYEIDSKPGNTTIYDKNGYYGYAQGGQSIPLFVNYRHYFPGKKALKPLVNFAIGTRINFWRERFDFYYNSNYLEDPYFDYYYYPPHEYQRVDVGLYATVAAGFKVKAFSFTSGFFLKSWKQQYFGGIEVKVGFTF